MVIFEASGDRLSVVDFYRCGRSGECSCHPCPDPEALLTRKAEFTLLSPALCLMRKFPQDTRRQQVHYAERHQSASKPKVRWNTVVCCQQA